MQLSAQLAMWGCAIFGFTCLGFAVDGFLSLTSVTDAAERETTAGYAWFWTFLGFVATVFGVLSWMIKEGKFGPVE